MTYAIGDYVRLADGPIARVRGVWPSGSYDLVLVDGAPPLRYLDHQPASSIRCRVEKRTTWVDVPEVRAP